ncbi:MAG: metalloregulator ArsR/SmtB family transcription factor [Granulosicoccus sp.]
MSIPTNAQLFAALGNEKRMQIVIWLHDPLAHFPTQIDGDLVDDGVCAGAIVNKLQVSQPTVASHMKILLNAELVRTKRIKQWTFYKLNPDVLRQARNVIAALV